MDEWPNKARYCFWCLILSANFKYAIDKDIKYANKTIAHLKQPVQIMCQNLGNECNLKLSIFVYASHGNLSDGGSQLGYLIMQQETVENVHFIGNQSKLKWS